MVVTIVEGEYLVEMRRGVLSVDGNAGTIGGVGKSYLHREVSSFISEIQ